MRSTAARRRSLRAVRRAAGRLRASARLHRRRGGFRHGHVRRPDRASDHLDLRPARLAVPARGCRHRRPRRWRPDAGAARRTGLHPDRLDGRIRRRQLSLARRRPRSALGPGRCRPRGSRTAAWSISFLRDVATPLRPGADTIGEGLRPHLLHRLCREPRRPGSKARRKAAPPGSNLSSPHPCSRGFSKASPRSRRTARPRIAEIGARFAEKVHIRCD